MKLTLIPALVALLGCSGVGAPSSSPTDRELPTTAEAQRMLDAGELDECLIATDAILANRPDDVAARVVAGRANVALVESGRDGAAYFLEDAINNLQRATELQPDNADAWLALSDAYLKASRFDDGVEAGFEAVAVLEAKNAPRARVAEAHLAVAANQMQIFVDTLRASEEDDQRDAKDRANDVLASATNASMQGAVVEGTQLTANVYLWLNRGKQALEALENGIDLRPDADQLHFAFQKIYFDHEQYLECVGAYRRMLRTHGERAPLLWHLGRVHATVADAHRQKGDMGKAAAAYEDARDSFARYGELNRSKSQWSDQWRAICEIALARIAFERSELDTATEHLIAAAEASPQVTATDTTGAPTLFAWPGCDYPRTLALVGQSIAESEDGLERGLDYWEGVIERHPKQYFFAYNNAALIARDLGEVLSKLEADEAGKRANVERALELWERAYRHYESAVTLAPEDARTLNDCGLMLVYYLHRDYDRARELFERAIEFGQPHVDALDEDSPESERQFREETVGDAYQNIGVMLVQLQRPASEIRPFFEKSLAYYPYRRRESVEFLRRLDGTATQDPERDPRKAAFEAKIRDAAAKADENDWDSALLVLDDMSTEMTGYAPFHYHFGLYSLRYAQAEQAGGGDAGLVSGLYADAKRQLQRAVEIDPDSIDARLQLGEACLATGEFDLALDKVGDALTRLQNDPKADPDQLLAAHAIRAVAGGRVYVTRKQAGDDDQEKLRAARASFAEVEKARPLTAAERDVWVNTERWAGAAKRAIEILARAVERAPDDQAVLGRLVDVGWETGETAAVVDELDSRRDALGRWFAGKARYNDAHSLWAGGKPEPARKRLDEAVKSFEAAARANPDYTASCDQWIALCLGLRGLVDVSAEDWEAARKNLLAALERDPACLTTDLGSGNVKRGLLVVGDHYFRNRELGKTADLYREVGALAPDDVDVANNEGLFCRDWGTALTKRGDRKQAAEYYEASYAAYTRAARLDPTNVRLRNDRALLLIYHLDRDLDDARRTLEQAIADGEEMLAESPPEDPAALRDLQEAVGDCWENLGYSHLEQTGDLAAARTALEKSLTYYPFERRASRRHLQKLEARERGDK